LLDFLDIGLIGCVKLINSILEHPDLARHILDLKFREVTLSATARH
jgi:hypothetical protein